MTIKNLARAAAGSTIASLGLVGAVGVSHAGAATPASVASEGHSLLPPGPPPPAGSRCWNTSYSEICEFVTGSGLTVNYISGYGLLKYTLTGVDYGSIWAGERTSAHDANSSYARSGYAISYADVGLSHGKTKTYPNHTEVCDKALFFDSFGGSVSTTVACNSIHT